MAELMGARCLLAGLRPGVVSALLEIGVDARGVEAVLNLDEAFRVMDEPAEPPEGAEPIDDENARDAPEDEGEAIGEE